MGREQLPRVTPEHTTAEVIEIMKDHHGDVVQVVDRDSKAVIGSISRDTLIGQCVRRWHEPARCRVGNHLGRR